MKTRKNAYTFLLIAVLAISFYRCENRPNVSLPVVETLEATDITQTTATSGGHVTNDGGAIITQRGICWDIQSQPDTSLLTKTSDGQDKGIFASELSGLLPNQQYFVRAYASNSAGTSYGNEITFTTKKFNTIIYKEDGREVKLGDLSPLALDVNEDGQVDFTIFVDLTANSLGDHLYVGINPIGVNLVKSGPAIDENFLNMGFVVSENPGAVIDESLETDQRWTIDHSTLVIRNTFTAGNITYEGSWATENQIAGIQNNVAGTVYFGWCRITFDKTTEIVTLVDYAYNSVANEAILAGQKSNERKFRF